MLTILYYHRFLVFDSSPSSWRSPLFSKIGGKDAVVLVFCGCEELKRYLCLLNERLFTEWPTSIDVLLLKYEATGKFYSVHCYTVNCNHISFICVPVTYQFQEFKTFSQLYGVRRTLLQKCLDRNSREESWLIKLT